MTLLSTTLDFRGEQGDGDGVLVLGDLDLENIGDLNIFSLASWLALLEDRGLCRQIGDLGMS